MSNIEITNYFNYEPIFNGVFSINNLPGIKEGAYVINFDDKKSKGANWISLFFDRNAAIYFDYFGIEYIPQEILNKIREKSITYNIFRIQDNESVMCGFCCIAFIECMPVGKTLLDYTILFSPNDYQNNDKVIYKYFKGKYGRRSKS